MSKIPDLKMVQDTKILQQIMGQLMKNGNHPTINVINIGQVNSLEDPKENHNDEDFDLIRFINSLSEPRLDNLTEKIIRLALSIYPDQASAGKWLGVSPRVICYQNKLLVKKDQNKEEGKT